MKKSIKIILIMSIMLLISIANVYAAEEKAKVELVPNVTEVKAGETFTIDVKVECEGGIEGLDSTLVYDKSKVELTNQEEINEASLSGTDGITGEYKLSFAVSSEEVITTKKFTTLKFKVLDNVEDGKSITIQLADIEFVGTEDAEIKMDDTEVNLTVKGATGEEPQATDPATDQNKDKDKDENKKDTQSNKPYDYNGLKEWGYGIIAVLGITSISYIGYKKYKNI